MTTRRPALAIFTLTIALLVGANPAFFGWLEHKTSAVFDISLEW